MTNTGATLKGGTETLAVDDTPPEAAPNTHGLKETGSKRDITETPPEKGPTLPTSIDEATNVEDSKSENGIL